MYETLENLKNVAELYVGPKDIELAVDSYKLDEDMVTLSYIFVELFGYTYTIVDKYWNITEEDKASFSTEELHKAMMDFDSSLGVPFRLFYSKYLKRRLYSETTQLNYQKRKANFQTENYDDVALTMEGKLDDSYEKILLLETIDKIPNLTTNEVEYCKLIVHDEGNKLSSSDIADLLGISASAITQMKQRLKSKLNLGELVFQG